MENITALILNVRKHTGNGVIVDTYTREHGRMAYAYSYTKANKGHKALISPMSWISFSTTGSAQTKLRRIKTPSPYKIQHSIGINPIKNMMAIFISEIISCTLREEHADADIFNFLDETLGFYDEMTEHYNNFHLCFLAGYAAMLGITPPIHESAEKDNIYLMWEGRMNKSEQALFAQICLTPMNESHTLGLNSNERSKQLNIMLDYYLHYASGFRIPKSLEMFRSF